MSTFYYKNVIKNFTVIIEALKNISSVSFSEDEKVEEKLKNLKINIELFDRFKAEKTTTMIESLNSSLDTVLEKVGLLQGKINKQKRLVKILIEKHRKSINSFITNASFFMKTLLLLIISFSLFSCNIREENSIKRFVVLSMENNVFASAKSDFKDTLFYEHKYPDSTKYSYLLLNEKQNKELKMLVENVCTEKDSPKYELSIGQELFSLVAV